MHSHWYKRDGTPIHTHDELGNMDMAAMREVERLLGDYSYRRVAETTLPDGKWISTVWLGLDHQFAPGGPPLIFETMVFASPGTPRSKTLDEERYSTETDARAGHERMLIKWLGNSYTKN